MGYKSRANYPMGQRVSQEHWNNIFNGGQDESKIRYSERISDVSVNVPIPSGECNQTQGDGEDNSGAERENGTSIADDVQTDCYQDADRIPHLHSGQEG